jgi:hypothetical protein
MAMVRGFAEQDPELGALVCGLPRRPLLVYAALAVAAGILALSLVLFANAGPGQVHLLGGAWFCFFLGMAVAIVAWFDLRRRGLAVYEGGVRTQRGRLRWQDCEHIVYAIKDLSRPGALPVRRQTLRLQGAGRAVRIRGTGPQTESVCTAIIERVVLELVARRLRELEGGQPFTIGRVTLTRQGISSKHGFVPVAEIGRVVVEDGQVRLWRHGEDKPAMSLPRHRRDVPVLLGLLDRLRPPSA